MNSGSRAQGVSSTMSSIKQRIRLMGALAALATLALAISCRGFFVKPTLSSLAVGPAAPTIDTGTTDNTVQMFAVGTFNDGSTGNTAVSWSISPSDNSIATISTAGLVTSVSTGSATVTATSNQNPSITGTQTVTVNLANVTALTLDMTTYTVAANNTTDATASAQTSGGKVDVSATATWATGNTSTATVVGGTDPVVITGIATGTTTVTATYTSGGSTFTATANVIVQ